MNDPDDDNYGLSLGNALGAECSHEAVHSTDSNEVHMDIRDAQFHIKVEKEQKQNMNRRQMKLKKYREELKMNRISRNLILLFYCPCRVLAMQADHVRQELHIV